MRPILCPCFMLFIMVMMNIVNVNAQNIGIGTATPTQKLDVNGGIHIGNTAVANAGTIRWNTVKSDFEGYNGNTWVSLTDGKGKWGDQSSYSNENTASQFGLIDAYTPGSELGNAMAGDGDWIAAGAYRDASPGSDTKWHTGSVRLMHRVNGVWRLEHSMYDPDAVNSDFFGFSVDMSATHVITGASNANMVGSDDQGKAYIYTYDINNTTLQATLLASDAQTYDYFGLAVGISGDDAVVGAPFNDILGVNNMGRAYVYKRSGNTWPEVQLLTPADGATDDRFGNAIAVWGEYLAISSPYKTYNGLSNAGKVYVYRKNGPSWILIQQFNSPAPNYGEVFGYRLVIKDNILLVSATDFIGGSYDSTGSVYIYSINNNTVSYEATLHASDGQNGDAFGSSIDYHNGVIIVGANRAVVRSLNRHGKAYIFKEINGNWQEEAILTSSTNEAQITFGTAVTLVQDYAVVGAPFADFSNRVDNGRLFFFKQY
jgi:FG-GAP repeat protein